jgi:hypothetical protein
VFPFPTQPIEKPWPNAELRDIASVKEPSQPAMKPPTDLGRDSFQDLSILLAAFDSHKGIFMGKPEFEYSLHFP